MNHKLLQDVRILDLTNVLAGPYAGYQLALMGADVVKVEAPDGDLARMLGASPALSERRMGISFLAQNGAKRSVTVNLKNDSGKEVLRTLVRSADVLLENFRPGVLDRLGLGWEVLHELNPRLIYCAISGFGQTGPLRSAPAYDQIIQGMSGLMAVTGDPESAPLRVGAPVSDTIGGLAAAFGIASALVGRERTGEGVFLDVSMLEATLTAMGWVASDYLVGGVEPMPMGNENRTAAPSGTFATADGNFNIAANKQEQFEELCRIIGRPELVDDERFAARESRKRHRLELKDEIEAALREQPNDHWAEVLPAAGIPGAPVLDVPGALASPHIRERQLVATLEVPALDGVTGAAVGPGGAIHLLGSPVHVNGMAMRPEVGPPSLGEHTAEVLSEIGFTAADIERLQLEGAV